MTEQTEEGVETSQTEAELSSAPAKAEIDRSLLTPFEAYDYLVIEQTRKGCCQEWCGKFSVDHISCLQAPLTF